MEVLSTSLKAPGTVPHLSSCSEHAYPHGVKRLLIIALAALLLAGILVVAWTVAGLPPVRMVVRYGFDYGPEPTGRTLTVEGVEFVEIGPGCFLMGSDLNGEPGDFLGGLCYPFGLPWGEQPEPSDEMPVHWVEFSRGFWVAKTEVTNEQYEAFDPKHKRKNLVLLSIASAVLGAGFFLTLDRLSAWYFNKVIVPAQQTELAEQESF